MSDNAYIDVESRSAIDLKRAGSFVYWEDQSTDLWCACWAIGEGRVDTWWPGQPCPPALQDHILSGGTISGWNVGGFEAIAFHARLGPKHGWPVPAPEQYDDTAAMAAAMGLPRDLGGASVALGLDVQKDTEGKALMMQLARPRRREIVIVYSEHEPWHDDYEEPRDELKFTWWDTPEKLERLAAYCVADVETERAARRRLVALSADERAVWLLDAKINARGIGIDRELARAMIGIVDQATTRLNAEIETVTGSVSKASQAAKLLAWTRDHGVAADSLAKAALADLLARDDLPEAVRRALEIRQEAAKASTAKLRSALACTSSDGRARGLKLYHGASTGRWSGRLFQPDNITRGSGVVEKPENAIPIMMRGSADLVALCYGPPLAAVSDCLRAVVCSAPEHDLLAADYSAIEGRVTAWLSGEAWKLDAFRANDAGTGAGLYEVAAAGIFDVPVAEVTKKLRQVGKVAELALGFAGGVLAFHSMAKNYPDVKMETALAPLWTAADAERRDKAEARYERCLHRREAGTGEMSRDAWIASELTKVGWREKHPATVAAWAELEDAARSAVAEPGAIVRCLADRIAFRVASGFLWMRLPSGRCLAYGSPKLKQQVWVRRRVANPEQPLVPSSEIVWEEDSEIMAKDAAEALAARGLVKIERAARAAVTALGVNSTTRKWERFALYSGLLMENAVQAVARDLMAAAMLRAEARGYPIVLTVHDEIVAEPEEGFGDLHEFERLICELPAWAAGLPVAAEGWRGKRYRK